MCALSFEWGMVTVSWNAVLALRNRASMSAIGSVIVMSDLLSRRGSRRPATKVVGCLPARLGDAGQLARVRHLPQADPAQAELAVDRVRAAAALATRVAADGELRLRRRLVLQSGLRHVSFFLSRGTGSPARGAARGPRRRSPPW